MDWLLECCVPMQPYRTRRLLQYDRAFKDDIDQRKRQRDEMLVSVSIGKEKEPIVHLPN